MQIESDYGLKFKQDAACLPFCQKVGCKRDKEFWELLMAQFGPTNLIDRKLFQNSSSNRAHYAYLRTKGLMAVLEMPLAHFIFLIIVNENFFRFRFNLDPFDPSLETVHG